MYMWIYKDFVNNHMDDKEYEYRKGQYRQAPRMKGYDYCLAGAYFVTIVSCNRLPLFGNVMDGRMTTNAFGKIAMEEWFKSRSLQPNIRLDQEEFVVMPNHIHGIVHIEDMGGLSRGAASLRPYNSHPNGFKINVPAHSLGAIVRAYKSAVTYHTNSTCESRKLRVWQRNYYDHIVRNSAELEKIRNNIETNPANWNEDRFYPAEQSSEVIFKKES